MRASAPTSSFFDSLKGLLSQSFFVSFLLFQHGEDDDQGQDDAAGDEEREGSRQEDQQAPGRERLRPSAGIGGAALTGTHGAGPGIQDQRLSGVVMGPVGHLFHEGLVEALAAAAAVIACGTAGGTTVTFHRALLPFFFHYSPAGCGAQGKSSFVTFWNILLNPGGSCDRMEKSF